MEATDIDSITDLAPLNGNFLWFQERLANIQEKHMVTTIDGSNYLIQRLEVGIFNDFLSLRVLNLAKNALTELQNGIFDCLVNLEIIDLSFNFLIDIQDSIFINNSKLVTINLANNMLSNINSNVFSTLLCLNCLDLSHNQIKYLNFFCLACVKLQKLDLSFNHIQNIDPAAFFELPELINLNLNTNQIILLPKKLFFSTIKLQYLNLGNNFITYIHAHAFSKLSSLTTLNLSTNLLKELNVINFIGKPNLTDLDITNNAIEKLKNDLFIGCPNLTNLKLMMCGPYNPQLFRNLKSLENLNFLSTYNETLSMRFFKCLNFNAIVKLKIVFWKAKFNMSALMCTFLNLEYLHVEFLEPTYTTSIINFEYLISRLKKLEYLTLKMINKFFIKIKMDVLNLRTLCINYLDLTGTQNKSIDIVIKNLVSLKYLILSSSKITHIKTNTMSNLVNLKQLVLKDSKFFVIQKNLFAHNINLEILDFENCPIQKIGFFAFINLINLKKLNLRGISLRPVTQYMLSGVPTTAEIYLS